MVDGETNEGETKAHLIIRLTGLGSPLVVAKKGELMI
jgi:hypothetical protein